MIVLIGYGDIPISVLNLKMGFFLRDPLGRFFVYGDPAEELLRFLGCTLPIANILDISVNTDPLFEITVSKSDSSC